MEIFNIELGKCSLSICTKVYLAGIDKTINILDYSHKMNSTNKETR